ncbi:MAG: serine/threonine protein kinase [Deltaproteobacteria bacterium]|nr:serine/threonine protein kinase [Deltaproteobacteria bacterium]
MSGDRTGQVIGERFRIDALIGKGAMADVYRALDQETAAFVALKILRTSLDGDPSARQRFAREAEVQARLRHRNVAALLATGITDQTEPYLAMELLRGKTLRGVIKREGQVDVRRASSYTWQALQGLAAVHEAGVLHRDLKPANIMLEPSPGPTDRVVLIDFGFASVEGSARLTQQGSVVGSLTYIAPERLRGEAIDQRSDLYSIAVIFYELLAGVPPFRAKDDLDLIELHLGAPPPPLPLALQPALQGLLDRALAKHQADRFASALEMAAALELAARDLA